MRRLWITRHKAAAAKTAKMNVYIEDAENGDVEIDGCLCRQLGELKNDQQKRFNIGYEAAKVYVVSEKADPEDYDASIQLPEGEEDIFLEGRNHRDPGAGNPFRFDGREEEATVEAEEAAEEAEVQKERKPVRRKGKGTLLVVIAILAGIAVGVAAGIFASSALLGDVQETAVAQTFRCQDLQITLTENFAETAVPGYTTCYTAGDTAVFLMREDFAAKEGFGELDLESYGAMILANNHIQDVALETADGLTTFAWVITDETAGIPYYYYCGLYKGQDAFWMVQITTEAEGAAEDMPVFRQWLKSVTLAG